MKKSERILFATLLVTLVLLCVSVCMNIYQHYHFADVRKMGCDTTVVTKVVTVEITDTAPRMQSEKVIGSVRIPAHTGYFQNGNSHKALSDTLVTSYDHLGMLDSKLPYPTDSIILPVVQREYSDSLYTAWVSGILLDSISPRLDSVRVKEKTIYQTVMIDRNIPCKKKRWHVGVNASYGYGFEHKKVEPFVGIGITYSLLSF